MTGVQTCALPIYRQHNDKYINDDKCPSHDGFADNIDYVHIKGQPIPTKRKDAVSGWPCVVIGAICETWFNTAEPICGTEPSAGTSERLDSTGFSDGPYVSTNH